MQPPFAAVDAGETVDRVFENLSGAKEAVLVARGGVPVAILTRSDLLEFLAHRRLQVDAV